MGNHANPKTCGFCGGKGKIMLNNDGTETEEDRPTCDGTGEA